MPGCRPRCTTGPEVKSATRNPALLRIRLSLRRRNIPEALCAAGLCDRTAGAGIPAGNHSIAIAQPGVAGRAVNIETLTTAGHDIFGRWKRHVVTGRAAKLARVKVRISTQITAGHRSLHRWAR